MITFKVEGTYVTWGINRWMEMVAEGVSETSEIWDSGTWDLGRVCNM